MHMNWEQTIARFRIEKVYWEASLSAVGAINQPIAQEGLLWLSNPKRQSLYLSGNPGSGKTYFAFSLLRGLVEQKRDAHTLLYVRSDDLDNELLRAIGKGDEEYSMEKYIDVLFLFI